MGVEGNEEIQGVTLDSPLIAGSRAFVIAPSSAL